MKNTFPVEVRNLWVKYPAKGRTGMAKTAVTALDLEIVPGEVFGLLGPNGAGKTSTMNVLLGFVNASEGEAKIFGETARNPQARRNVGYLPELTYYYKFLTAEELLRFYAKIFEQCSQFLPFLLGKF